MPNIYRCGFKRGSKIIIPPNVNDILPQQLADGHSIISAS